MEPFMYYTLDKEHNLIPTKNVLVWGRFFDNADNRRVGMTKRWPITVSTVFIGIDHNFEPEGPPVLFETMVFDSWRHGDYCRRYHTWDEAQAGHAEVEKMVFRGWGVVVDLLVSQLLYLWNNIPRLPVYESWGDTLKWLFCIKGG